LWNGSQKGKEQQRKVRRDFQGMCLYLVLSCCLWCLLCDTMNVVIWQRMENKFLLCSLTNIVKFFQVF
jgi:hypothetical protein